MLRLQGFNVTAKPCVAGSKLEYLSNGRCFEVWKNIDGTSATHISTNGWMTSKGYQEMSPSRYLEFFNEVCKDEGVYELCIAWSKKAGGGGHATILQRFSNGSLKYIEPQIDNSVGSGYEWKDINYLAKKGVKKNHKCRGIMRIDNKKFDLSFIDIFNK